MMNIAVGENGPSALLHVNLEAKLEHANVSVHCLKNIIVTREDTSIMAVTYYLKLEAVTFTKSAKVR